MKLVGHDKPPSGWRRQRLPPFPKGYNQQCSEKAFPGIKMVREKKVGAACSALAVQFNKSLSGDEPDANALLSRYCNLLYNRFGTYEEVARRMKLDRRTVKKYITQF
jgi:hypothetical protein